MRSLAGGRASALTAGRRRPGRPRGTSGHTSGASARTTHATSRTTRARTGRRASAGPGARSTRRRGNTRAAQALDLVRKQPGVTIPELATGMKIQPNYLYRVLPRLASEGQVKRQGQGWHLASQGYRSRRAGGRAVDSRSLLVR